MFTQKWNEWVLKYGLENTVFVVRDKDCMKINAIKFGFDNMVKSYEESLDETID